MSDLFLISAFIACVYALESFALVGPRAWVYSGAATRMRARSAARGIALGDRVLVYVGIAPWTRWVASEVSPLCVDRQQVSAEPWHVLAPALPITPAWQVSLAALEPLTREGARLNLGGAHEIACASPQVAEAWRARLRLLALAPPDERDPLIDAWHDQLVDDRSFSQRLTETRVALVGVELASLALMAYVFVVMPALVAARLGFSAGPLFAVYGVLALWAMIEAARAHRRLWPAARGERIGLVLTMLVSPADAMRVAQGLFARNLAGAHPLAVARVIGDEGELVRVIAATGSALLVHPQPGADAERARRIIGAWLAARGLAPLSRPRPPAPGAGEGAWCPYCQSRFRELGACCPECGPVPLESLARPEASLIPLRA